MTNLEAGYFGSVVFLLSLNARGKVVFIHADDTGAPPNGEAAQYLAEVAERFGIELLDLTEVIAGATGTALDGERKKDSSVRIQLEQRCDTFAIRLIQERSAESLVYVDLTDGSGLEIGAPMAISLIDALECASSPENLIDAGSEGVLSKRSLRVPGGRTEFERGRQRMITEWLADNEQAGAKRVMLIGDSIRMRIVDATGYGVSTYSSLLGSCNLIHIPHNCGGTLHVLENINDWLSARPDIVHFNAGLHDLGFSLQADWINPSQTSLLQYRENLQKLFSRILATDARLIWALNPPVDDELHLGAGRQLGRRDADVRTYNEVSIEVANEFGLPINNLYRPLIEGELRTVLLPDGVHLNERGSELCGRLVAEMVRSYL